MKKMVFPLILSVLLTTLTTTSSLQAGQIVSKEFKSWARAALEGKPSAKIATAPGSVAILNFSNQTGRSDIAPLEKGLALMLAADLSQIKGIRVVDRGRVQALLDAMGLKPTASISPDTALRLGKMLGAFYVISGKIVRGRITDLKIMANLVEVPNDMLLDQPVSAGDLADLVSMQKEILFDLINAFQLALGPDQLKLLEKPISSDIDALYFLFRGIDSSDRGKYDNAAALYKKALRQDPQLAVASSALDELQVSVFRAQAPRAAAPPVKPAPAATVPKAEPSVPSAAPSTAPATSQATALEKAQPPTTESVPETKTIPEAATLPDAKTTAAGPPPPATGTPPSPAEDQKMSTGTIVAIGIGAAAVIGGIAVAAGGGGGGGDEAPPSGGGTPPPPEPVPQAPLITGVDPPAGSAVSCTAGTLVYTFDTDMDTSAGQVGVSVPDWQFTGDFSNPRTYVISWDDNCPEPENSDDLPAMITFVFANFQDTSQTPLEGDAEFTFDLTM